MAIFKVKPIPIGKGITANRGVYPRPFYFLFKVVKNKMPLFEVLVA
jgi:hypothetical protein